MADWDLVPTSKKHALSLKNPTERKEVKYANANTNTNYNREINIRNVVGADILCHKNIKNLFKDFFVKSFS